MMSDSEKQSDQPPFVRVKKVTCPKCRNPLRPSTDVSAREVTEESSQLLYCARCGHEQWAKKKETWNFKKFVEYYNALARDEAGWIFDPTEDGHEPETLKALYEPVDDYRTLREYARGRFVFEQQTGVEGSD